jgi:competence protein ComEC
VTEVMLVHWFRLEFGGFSALFTGDLEISEEKIILTSGGDLQSVLLKIGHHGSKGSTSEEFLSAVHPTYAAISAGKQNSYGHPSPRVLQLLQQHHIPFTRTDIDGEVTYQTDGTDVWIKTRVL